MIVVNECAEQCVTELLATEPGMRGDTSKERNMDVFRWFITFPSASFWDSCVCKSPEVPAV